MKKFVLLLSLFSVSSFTADICYLIASSDNSKIPLWETKCSDTKDSLEYIENVGDFKDHYQGTFGYINQVKRLLEKGYIHAPKLSSDTDYHKENAQFFIKK